MSETTPRLLISFLVLLGACAPGELETSEPDSDPTPAVEPDAAPPGSDATPPAPDAAPAAPDAPSPGPDALVDPPEPAPTAVFSGLTEATAETVGGVPMPQLDAVQSNAAEYAGGIDDLEYARLVQAIHEVGDVVYLGGGFHDVGGVRREHLAAFDHRHPERGILPWNPEVDGHQIDSGNNMMRGGIGGVVRAFVSTRDGRWLYVAGNFTSIGGKPRHQIARISTWDGTSGGLVDDGFVPVSFGTGRAASVAALALSPDERTLYVGGDFATPASGVVALDARTGARVGTAGADPAAGSFRGEALGGRVEGLALSPDGAILYVGGKLTTLVAGGVSVGRTYLGAFRTAGEGSVDPWHPGGSGWAGIDYVLDVALSPDGRWLATGDAGGGVAPNNALTVFKVHAHPDGPRDAYWSSVNSTDDNGNMQAVAVSNSHAFGTSHARGPRLVAIDLATGGRETTWSTSVQWKGGTRGGWAIHLSDEALNVGGSCNSPRLGYARFRALAPAP